ncbi:MAG: ABC transporter substrate-binding protein [Solirubrobacteraceae bacterium]
MRARGLVAFALAIACVSVAAGTASAQAAKKVLRLGQAQDAQTLSPFIDQDEEDFRVWSINYKLLVDFSPKDLGPVPGIAKSWDISPDKKTVTFKLFDGAKWSDGQPITSKDVKYSFETFAPNSLLFGSYVENITSIETPDPLTVIIKTKQPDARIVGGLFAYILPEHVWGKVPVKKLTASYKPTIPMVGSGPFVVTSFEHGRILRMSRNRYYSGPKPKFDEVQWIKYGTNDAVERALSLGEIDIIPEVQEAAFARLRKAKNVKAVSSASPSFTQLAFNLCNRQNCPDAKFEPAVQDRTVRQAIAYAIDRKRVNQIASRGTAFPGHGLLPEFYKSFYSVPADDYPLDVAKANQMLDAAGWKKGGEGVRAKGGDKLSFDLFVRSESPQNIQDARLVSEMTKPIGVDFKVKIVSVDKLTEITTRKVKGKMAPDFDTFIWGWGGDPYDPGLLLNLLTTKAIGGSSDAFYSNPEYDRLYDEQSGEFDQAKRKQIVSQMIAISQRDLPYIVLTVDPVLQAYRSDKLSGVARSCPQPSGDVTCDQVTGATFVSMGPATRAAGGGGGDRGGDGLPIVLIVLAALIVLGVVVLLLRRRRAGREAIELER